MKKFNYIYKITNLINGKIYIGKHSTDDLDDKYLGSGSLIGKAKKKYGIENFSKEYLAFCDTEETLNWMERFYIRKFNARNLEIGYNLTDGGEGVLGLKREAWNKGLRNIYSEETKKKMGEANKGKTAWNKGCSTNEQTKQKISTGTKTAMQDKELRKHLSENKAGKTSNMKGKHLSEESKKKISESLTGRKGSPSIWAGKHWKLDKDTNKRIYY